MPIIVNVDVMLARRKMRLNTLAELVGITPQNLSVLKTWPGPSASARWSGSARFWNASPATCCPSRRIQTHLRLLQMKETRYEQYD